MIVEFIKNIIKIIVALFVVLILMASIAPSPWFHWFILADTIIGIPILAYCITYKVSTDELIEKFKNL